LVDGLTLIQCWSVIWIHIQSFHLIHQIIHLYNSSDNPTALEYLPVTQ